MARLLAPCMHCGDDTTLRCSGCSEPLCVGCEVRQSRKHLHATVATQTTVTGSAGEKLSGQAQVDAINARLKAGNYWQQGG